MATIKDLRGGASVALLLIAQASSVCAEMRIWKGRNGNEVEAEFIHLDQDTAMVILAPHSGKGWESNLYNFIAEDQALIRRTVKRYRDLQGQPAYEAALKYYEGDGVRQSFQLAYLLFASASGFGHVAANFRLGLCYDEGKGTLVDREEARVHYRIAAEQEHAGAQNNLGILLENGLGGTRDKARARYWYRKAAAQGSGSALANLGLGAQEKGHMAVAADFYIQSGRAYLRQKNREGALRQIDRLDKIGATVLADTLRSELSRDGTQPAPTTAIPRVHRSNRNQNAHTGSSRKVYLATDEEQWIRKVMDGGSVIELADSSVWEVSRLSRIDTALWIALTDVVVIEGDGVRYPYKMINKDDGEIADVRLLSK